MFIIRKIYNFLIDTIQSLLLAASVFLVIYIFFFRPFQVKGESMYPNFRDNQYILTNIISLHFHDPKLGVVIVFKSPQDPEKDYIKRVIGVPGDRVLIKDGNIYLNGKKLDEISYIKREIETNAGSFLKESQEITVTDENYFVLGDNRLYSSDSREWGFVPRKNIIGESFFAYWPLDSMSLIKNPYK
ncbi:MAG: signal peptidase I [Patescibacteria group bacterium]